MADLDLQEIHDFLITIAHKAGEMITAAHPSTGAAGSKKNCKTSNPASGYLQCHL
jgi:myo-inositol-1(or 4)-monophosphatase